MENDTQPYSRHAAFLAQIQQAAKKAKKDNNQNPQVRKLLAESRMRMKNASDRDTSDEQK